MKHYLLTWYGITDLRAALGLEATDGPILCALKTNNFTDVIILAYTNPDKDHNAFTNEPRALWEKWRSNDLETRLKFPREKAQQFVDAVSNTMAGHTLFADWLQAEMTTAGISCNIQIIPQELKHLNDAQGIYNAAAAALKCALDDVSEKTLASFVSPGTPVMAYTWALIARANPQHNIAVIASSDPRKPPETIFLPKDLLMPVVTAPQADKPSKFDVIIHLLGREGMPIFFGMLQFQAAVHIFITTKEYQNATTNLSKLLHPSCRVQTVIIQDPFKPADTRKEIEKLVGDFPAATKIAANLTGGTKLMFAGALTACWQSGVEPFYFEINNHNVIFLRDGGTAPFVGTKLVSDFFTVNGFDIIKQGWWNDQPNRQARLAITNKLWEKRKIMGSLYTTKEFRDYKSPWGARRSPPFDWKWGKSQASFNSNGGATFFLDNEPISVPPCDDFAQFLSGGWLEEYVFSLLSLLEEKGVIHDLRIGVEVGITARLRYRDDAPTGEFDCSFTDGKRLWIVECKAGQVKQEHIQKLENNLKTYGGIAAKGIIVSSFTITPALSKRISSSTSIIAVHPGKLSTATLSDIITQPSSQRKPFTAPSPFVNPAQNVIPPPKT